MHVGGENLSDIDDIGRREQEGGDGRKGLSPATVGSVTNHTWITEIAKALKTVPGVDTSKLQTFDTQAQAAVATASTPPPSIPPPTPPPPPKPNLVLDDDDAAVGLRGWFVACVAAMLMLVLVV